MVPCMILGRSYLLRAEAVVLVSAPVTRIPRRSVVTSPGGLLSVPQIEILELGMHESLSSATEK
jgi:hypothetical protein